MNRIAFISALFVFASGISPAFAQDNSSLSAEVTASNFDQVNDGIYRGGLPLGDDLYKLKDLNIKTVVDFTVPEDVGEEALAEQLGFRYVNIPWTLTPSRGMGKYPEYEQIVGRFLDLVEDKNNLPVYVHCQLGRDRTGSVIGAYRIAKQGWTAEQAVEEMERYGFKGEMFPNLVQFLKEFEQRVRKQDL